MKLKYYLRGLGIGMIVTALILGISFSNRDGQTAQSMTDDQIRERAEQLGMVDSSDLTLAALQNSAKQQVENHPETQTEQVQTEQTQEPAETQEQITTNTNENENTAMSQQTQEAGTEATPETVEKADTTVEVGQTQGSETTAENNADTPSQQTQTATITIQKGASSGSVSTELYEAGLVENAKAFDNYLCNNGYSRSIHPGTYEIAPGTAEETIAKIITGKH